jgi:hypothetical protein
MSEAQPVDIKTEIINAAPHKRNQARIDADEAELEALKKRMRGEVDETEEETDDSEPDSQRATDTQVQNESVPEQETKAEPEGEAQEEDSGLSAEEKTFKQRYGDLRRHMQEKEKETAAKLEKLQQQLEASTKNELVLPKSEEEIDAWAKQYPDVAGIIEAIADKKATERASELDGRLKEIEEMRTTARKEKAEAELYSLHPDFAEIRADDTFHDWAKEQPKVVQDALYDNVDDVKSVARVLDLYKTDKGIKTKRVATEDKSAASSVKARKAAPIDPDDSSRYLRESQVAKMSIKEYEKRAEEIMEAQRSGKFIYDMSKR